MRSFTLNKKIDLLPIAIQTIENLFEIVNHFKYIVFLFVLTYDQSSNVVMF